MHTPEQIAAWKRVTDAVHARGAKMFMQFMHCGRIAHPLNRQIADAPVAPSAVKPAGQMWTDQQQLQDYPTPRALETAELPALIDEFVTAARNAIEAGFDGVELHAANGYLLNQFLASNCNLRTDGYGTSLNGRIRFVVEVVEAVAAAIGASRTAIRVSPGHMFNDIVDANPLETHVALLDALPTADMAYVHVMLPDAFSPQLNNAGDPQALLRTLRTHVKGALIAAGNLTRRERTGTPGLRPAAARGVRASVHRQPGPGRAHEERRAAGGSARGSVLHGRPGGLQRLSAAGGVSARLGALEPRQPTIERSERQVPRFTRHLENQAIGEARAGRARTAECAFDHPPPGRTTGRVSNIRSAEAAPQNVRAPHPDPDRLRQHQLCPGAAGDERLGRFDLPWIVPHDQSHQQVRACSCGCTSVPLP